jgi:ribosome-associated protein
MYSENDDLIVTGRVRIPRAELSVRAMRAGGPGGQHVNTSSTKIELRWNVAATRALSEMQRARALERLASKLAGDGSIRITASEYRSQAQNRDAAEARLVAMVKEAIAVPKVRRKTKRPRGAEESRLDTKRQQSGRKAARRWRPDE